jgi:hypothetical protein
MMSLELQTFGTVFLLKITIGGSFEPSAVMQKTTVKFDFSWPVVATETSFAPFRFTVLELGMSKLMGTSSIFPK